MRGPEEALRAVGSPGGGLVLLGGPGGSDESWRIPDTGGILGAPCPSSAEFAGEGDAESRAVQDLG